MNIVNLPRKFYHAYFTLFIFIKSFNKQRRNEKFKNNELS